MNLLVPVATACVLVLVNGKTSFAADELVSAPAPGQQVKLRLQEYAFKTKRNVEVAWGHWQTPHPEHPLSTVVRVTVDSLGKSNITIMKSSTDVRRAVKKLWHPPSSAESKEVTVQFKLMTDGTVTDARVTKSSEAQAFDDAALDAVKQASPLNDLPRGSNPRGEEIELTFVYSSINSTQPASTVRYLGCTETIKDVENGNGITQLRRFEGAAALIASTRALHQRAVDHPHA